MLSRLFSLFTFVNSQRQREEDWLAQSTDLLSWNAVSDNSLTGRQKLIYTRGYNHDVAIHYGRK